MSALIDLLFTHTWWHWQGAHATPTDQLYRLFNLCEMVTFASLGMHVLVRAWRQHRLRGVELSYGLSFLLLSATDAREAQVVQSWLICVKLLLLAQILACRSKVLRRHYPGARI
jgi:hypothetical protein